MSYLLTFVLIASTVLNVWQFRANSKHSFELGVQTERKRWLEKQIHELIEGNDHTCGPQCEDLNDF